MGFNSGFKGLITRNPSLPKRSVIVASSVEPVPHCHRASWRSKLFLYDRKINWICESGCSVEIVQTHCVHVVVMKAVDVRTDGQTDGRQRDF